MGAITDTADGEWLSYTVYVPTTGMYQLQVRYAAASGDGKIRFAFNGRNVTGEVPLPDTGGFTCWASDRVGGNVPLIKGVQSMRVYVSGDSGSYRLDSIAISETTGMANAIR